MAKRGNARRGKVFGKVRKVIEYGRENRYQFDREKGLDFAARRLPPHRHSEAHNVKLFGYRGRVARPEKRRNSNSEGNS